MKKWMAGVLSLGLALTLMSAPAQAFIGPMPVVPEAGVVFTAGMRARLTTQTVQHTLDGAHGFSLAVANTAAGSQFRLHWIRADGTTFLISPVLITPAALTTHDFARRLYNHGIDSTLLSDWTGWGAVGANIVNVGDYLEVEVVSGQFITSFAGVEPAPAPPLSVPYALVRPLNAWPPYAGTIGLTRWHYERPAITIAPPVVQGNILEPLHLAIIQSQTISVSGDIINLPAGAQPIIRVHHPFSNYTRDVPISDGQFQVQIQILTTGAHDLTLGYNLNNQFHTVDSVGISILEPSPPSPPNPLQPPSPPTDQGILSWLQYGIEIIVFWITYPFRAIALLLQQASQNLSSLVSNTGGFFRLMSTFWEFLPSEMSTGLAVAAPLLLVLWAVKR